MFLRFAYTVFIGVLLATFIGVGISAFYTGPKPPETPVELKYPSAPMHEGATPSAEFIQRQTELDQKFEEYTDQREQYERNISIVALVFAITILVVSLTILRNVYVISDGVLLGGVLTLLYSIVRGFGAEDSYYRVLVTGVGLAVALTLGYLKMVRPAKK